MFRLEEFYYGSSEWIGMVPDESPKHGGPMLRIVSQNVEISMTGIQNKSLKTDYAYLAFDTPEELDQIRRIRGKGRCFAYNYETR